MKNGMNQTVRICGGNLPDIDQILTLAKKRFPAIPSTRLPSGDLMFGNEHISVDSLLRTIQQCAFECDEFKAVEEFLLSVLADSARRQKNGYVSGNTPDLFSVFQRLFPILLSQTKKPVLKERSLAPVSQNWLGNVAIGYAIEDAQSYQVINRLWLEIWGISIEELHAIAFNNLEETILRTTVNQNDLGNLSLSEVRSFQSESGITVLTPPRASAYNASHILSPLFQRCISGVLGNEWLMAVPARDLWVAASRHIVDDKKGFAQFQRSVAHYFGHWPQPINEQLYQVSNDGVSIWDDRHGFSLPKAA